MLDQLITRWSALSRLVLEVGYLEGTPEEFLAIARMNFLGSRPGVLPVLPARPVPELVLAASGPEVSKVVADVASGDDPHTALDALGKRLVARFRKTIAEDLTPNAPATIAQKGYDAPLRGSRDRFLEHLTYRVVRA